MKICSRCGSYYGDQLVPDKLCTRCMLEDLILYMKGLPPEDIGKEDIGKEDISKTAMSHFVLTEALRLSCQRMATFSTCPYLSGIWKKKDCTYCNDSAWVACIFYWECWEEYFISKAKENINQIKEKPHYENLDG
jgi:hypothetical protein